MTTPTTTEHPRHAGRRISPNRGLKVAAASICAVALAASGVAVGLTVASAATKTHHTHVVVVMSSATVKLLQQELASLNYYNGPIDGIYGPQTKAAVTYLQRDASIHETGRMNAATQAALQRFLADGNSQMNPKNGSTVSVVTLQKDLGLLNYYEGPIDGVDGVGTQAAIKDLQRDAGLPQTGQMNATTQAALQRFLANGNSQMNPGPLTPATAVVYSAR